jgi:hypothetical protein
MPGSGPEIYLGGPPGKRAAAICANRANPRPRLPTRLRESSLKLLQDRHAVRVLQHTPQRPLRSSYAAELAKCSCRHRRALAAGLAHAPKSTPEQRLDRHELRTAHVDLCVLSGSRRSRRCGSQKWEPMCSAVLGRSATQSDSSRRSVAPHSTQSDGDGRLDPLWISLTRKRSQVQILYGPRRFSKLCLPVRAAMRASHLQFCPSVAGHSALGCGFTGDSRGFGILSGGSVDLPWRSLGRGSITESERLCTCHCADSAPTSRPTDTPRRNARLKVMRDRTSKKAEHLSPRLMRR